MSEIGCEAAREVGDGMGANFNAVQIVYARIAGSRPLAGVLADVEWCQELGRATGNDYFNDTALCIQRMVLALRGATTSVASLSGGDFDEAAFAARLEAHPLMIMPHLFRGPATMARFLGGDFEGAWRLYARTAELRATGLHVLPPFMMYLPDLLGVLAGAAIANGAAPGVRSAILAVLASEAERWARMAALTPDNFRAHHLLVQAEWCRLCGDRGAVLPLFEAALDAARASGFLHLEAIACELAARFLRASGVDTAARTYLREAHRVYGQWGALGKVRLLESQHPELGELSALSRSPKMPASALDMMTLAKASQAIAGELELERLLPLLIRIAVESSGARKGHLLLADSSGLRIVASVDETGHATEHRLPLAEPGVLASSVVHYAHRTGNLVLLDEATIDQRFASDPYLRSHRSGSILCAPISHGSRATGALYLENDLIASAFTPARVALVTHLAAHAAVALDNARLFSAVRKAQDESQRLTTDLRRLASEIIVTEDHERRLLARDLHDSIGQSLPAIKLALETFAACHDAPPLDAMAAGLGAIHQQLRTLTFELYPTMLDDLGLATALAHFGERLASEGLVVSVNEVGQPRPLSQENAIFLFRATRELLRNVVKHARARETMVCLTWRTSSLRLVVADDGVGIGDRDPWHTGGIGLFDIRERVTHLGGRLQLESTHGFGTVVTLDLPLEVFGAPESART